MTGRALPISITTITATTVRVRTKRLTMRYPFLTYA
jgi:hypothetical protein